MLISHYRHIIFTIIILQITIFLIGLNISWKSKSTRNKDKQLPLVVKIYISITLVISAFCLWYNNVQINLNYYTLFVMIGMTLSFIGDLIMSRIIKKISKLKGGILLFGLAHCFYILAYFSTILAYNKSIGNLVIVIIVVVLFNLFVLIILLKKHNKNMYMTLGVCVYGSIIGIMASMALILAILIGGQFWIAFIGASIFLISDLLVLLRTVFKRQIKNISLWIWCTYVLSQMGIIYCSLI